MGDKRNAKRKNSAQEAIFGEAAADSNIGDTATTRKTRQKKAKDDQETAVSLSPFRNSKRARNPTTKRAELDNDSAGEPQAQAKNTSKNQTMKGTGTGKRKGKKPAAPVEEIEQPEIRDDEGNEGEYGSEDEYGNEDGTGEKEEGDVSFQDIAQKIGITSQADSSFEHIPVDVDGMDTDESFLPTAVSTVKKQRGRKQIHDEESDDSDASGITGKAKSKGIDRESTKSAESELSDPEVMTFDVPYRGNTTAVQTLEVKFDTHYEIFCYQLAQTMRLLPDELEVGYNLHWKMDKKMAKVLKSEQDFKVLKQELRIQHKAMRGRRKGLKPTDAVVRIVDLSVNAGNAASGKASKADAQKNTQGRPPAKVPAPNSQSNLAATAAQQFWAVRIKGAHHCKVHSTICVDLPQDLGHRTISNPVLVEWSKACAEKKATYNEFPADLLDMVLREDGGEAGTPAAPLAIASNSAEPASKSAPTPIVKETTRQLADEAAPTPSAPAVAMQGVDANFGTPGGIHFHMGGQNAGFPGIPHGMGGYYPPAGMFGPPYGYFNHGSPWPGQHHYGQINAMGSSYQDRRDASVPPKDPGGAISIHQQTPATTLTPKSDVDYPILEEWLAQLDLHPLRGRDGQNYKQYAAALRNDGRIRLDDVVEMGSGSLKVVCSIPGGTADRILRYAREDALALQAQADGKKEDA